MNDKSYCFMICVNEKKKITDVLYDIIYLNNILNFDYFCVVFFWFAM